MSVALVVGYGSVGARHARLLTELGCRTVVVSKRNVNFPIVYSDLAVALTKENPQYVVIANETNRHHETLLMLAQLHYEGITLVEKPLFSRYIEISPLPFQKVFVAYNLRFHPIIQRLKWLLADEHVLSVQAYVGQYLPDWRPSSDYRASYSASAEQGGGVLRDLSHELDYLTWMLEGWKRVSSLGGHLSSLKITSDDVFALMMVTPSCPVVTLQMNYLDRVGRRLMIINTAKHTIKADLIKGTIMVDKDNELFSVARDDTYHDMHEALLSGREDIACFLDEGLETLRLIEATERAAKCCEWVER